MTEQNSRRGQGSLAGALARKSRVPKAAQDTAPDAQGEDVQDVVEGVQRGTRTQASGGRGRSNAGRGGRAASARRGGSTEYKQCLAYVRRDIRDRVEQARIDPGVRAGLVVDLRERGVQFKPDNPEYSALVELLLIEWLEAVDYAVEG